MRQNISLSILGLLILFPLFVSAEGLKLSSMDWDKDSIQFNVSIPKRCMFGDFNAINMDMSYSKSPKLLFSIKNLNSGEEKVQAIFSEMTEGKDKAFQTYESLMKGDYRFESALPGASDAAYLIQICSDTKGNNTCKNKKVQDINQILSVYRKPPKNYVPSDTVYFSQVILKNDGQVFWSDQVIAKNNSDNFQHEADKIVRELPSDALNNLATLQSLPFSFEENRLAIQLPVYNQAKCG